MSLPGGPTQPSKGLPGYSVAGVGAKGIRKVTEVPFPGTE